MWTFEQKSGDLLGPDGKLVEVGYAGGACGTRPESVNNPDFQYVSGVGPLPVGWYTFGVPVAQSHLGPFAIPLQPDADNDMRGRGGFFCHGDTTPSGNASEGCIIMSRATRNRIAESGDNRLQVV
jgi:Protein of unknown function (DUF2778)